MRAHTTGYIVGVVLLFRLVAFATPAKSEDVIKTREVVVSSTRVPDVPVDARTLPAKVTIITAEDIQKSGAKTIQEAIQWATGIVMYDGVGNAFQQTIDLRGFNGLPVPNTTVFVDGQRMNEPDFNTVNFDLIPYETIDRIEIIPGAAAIYGKNAMGGVINIITKRGTDKHHATGETLFGSWQRKRYTVNASGPIGKFDYYTNFSEETESGYRDESGGRITRAFGKVGYRPTERTDIAVAYTYVNNRLHQAGTLPLSLAEINPRQNFTPGDFFDSETNVVRMNARQELPYGFSVNLNGFYRRLAQDQFTRGQSSQSSNTFTTESRGGVFQLNHDAGMFGLRNVLVLGSEYTRNDFDNRLVSSFLSFPGSFPTVQSTDETILGLYAQDTLHLTSQLILTGGVRYDRNEIEFLDELDSANNGSKVFHRTTPRAGLTYLMTPGVSLYFNYGQGFRVPTYNELFGLGPFGANPNLRPSRSHNYEVGAKVHVQTWGEVSVALFRADVRDEILLVCGDPSTCNFGIPTNQNIPESRRQGIETTFKAKLNQYFDGIVNYTYTEATFQTDLTLNPYFDVANLAPFLEHVTKGDYIPLVPKNRLGVTGNFYPAAGWTVSLTGLYVSSQFFQGDEENAQPRIPSYFTLNSRIAYEQPVPGGHLSGYVMLNNILDEGYYTSGIMASNTLTGGGRVERFVMPAPTIAVYGGVSYRFEGL
ncbi:MAG TPA: TonB-dependent receptor [Nitrospiraceae bacterium]|nr:TonB-dependent receptor [Nitrospiraceae bacterium]